MDRFLNRPDSSHPKPEIKKKPREQTFCDKYLEEFPFIAKSSISNKHAFCKVCRRNILISHGVEETSLSTVKKTFTLRI